MNKFQRTTPFWKWQRIENNILSVSVWKQEKFALNIAFLYRFGIDKKWQKLKKYIEVRKTTAISNFNSKMAFKKYIIVLTITICYGF
jgi:hypothetical protein